MRMENLTTITEFVLVGLSNHRQTQIVLFVVVLFIYSLTVLGNLVIIILVQMDFRLNTPMYFFLTHLSGLEICYVSSSLPQMMAHLLAGNGSTTFTRCAIQMYTLMVLCGVECFLLAAMAYDRYVAICQPLVYALVMGKGRQIQLASASWAGGFFIATVNATCALQHPYCGSNSINHFICELPVVLKLACGDIHITGLIILATAVFILLGPLSVILTSYGLILSSVLKMRSTTGLRKAFSTCSSHLAVVTLFYGALIIMYLRPGLGTDSDFGKVLAVFYIMVTPLLNPIIYTLRNKDVHGAMSKMLRRWVFGQKR